MGDTTDNRSYRKPLSTDGVADLTDYWRDLADDVDADVDGIVTDYLTAVSDTSIGSVATGFTVASQTVRSYLDGQLIWLNLSLTVTTAISQTSPGSGNITDTLCFTLDSAYRPAEEIGGVCWSNGNLSGEATINTDGSIMLRTATADVTVSTIIRMWALIAVAPS